METLKSTTQASLAQWQSTSLVGTQVTRGHEFNSHRRHLPVITQHRSLFWHLNKTVFNFDFCLLPILLHILVRMAERSKALRSGRSPVFWARVRIPLLTLVHGAFHIIVLHSSTVNFFVTFLKLIKQMWPSG